MGFWSRLFGKEVTEDDIINEQDAQAAEIEELQAVMKQLQAEMRSTKLEMFDYIEGTLAPLNRRIATRMSREKSKEPQEPINTPPSKTKGMLTSQDVARLKGHGTHIQD